MEIRKTDLKDGGFELNIKVSMKDLVDTIEDAQKNNNKVVTSIANMDDKYLEDDPSLLLLLLASTASLKIKQRDENTKTLSKGRKVYDDRVEE